MIFNINKESTGYLASLDIKGGVGSGRVGHRTNRNNVAGGRARIITVSEMNKVRIQADQDIFAALDSKKMLNDSQMNKILKGSGIFVNEGGNISNNHLEVRNKMIKNGWIHKSRNKSGTVAGFSKGELKAVVSKRKDIYYPSSIMMSN